MSQWKQPYPTLQLLFNRAGQKIPEDLLFVPLQRPKKNRGKKQLLWSGGLPKTVTQKQELTGIRDISVQKSKT